MLIRNERSTAGTEFLWRLAVVTQALTSLTLKLVEYMASHVLGSSTPHVLCPVGLALIVSLLIAAG